MTTGHFGFAAVVKSKEPQVPLWALMLSTYLLDLIFVFLAGMGIESFSQIDPTHPAYGQVIIHAYYTHSLIGAAIIAVAAGLLGSIKWGKRSGIVIGVVAFSHWILDLIVHRPDLPILPGNIGNLPLLGFGLWQYPVISALLELALVIVGVYLYYRSAAEVSRSNQEQRRTMLPAVISTTVLAVLLLLLLASDLLSFSFNIAILLMLLLIILCGWLDSKVGWSQENNSAVSGTSVG